MFTEQTALLQVEDGWRFKGSSVTILSFRIEASEHRSCSIWSRGDLSLSRRTPLFYRRCPSFGEQTCQHTPTCQLLNECPFDALFAVFENKKVTHVFLYHSQLDVSYPSTELSFPSKKMRFSLKTFRSGSVNSFLFLFN